MRPIGRFARENGEAMALLPSSAQDDEKDTVWVGCSLAALGPAIVCCLADGDAGSLIVAAQSGTRWRYGLTLVQVMLVPILFAILESLVRTGVSEKRGFGGMVRAHFGEVVAIVSLVFLLLSSSGAIVSEMSGIAGVAALWGVDKAAASIATAIFVISIVVLCDYKQVEMVALGFGLFELVFVVVLFYIRPPIGDVLRGMLVFDLSDPGFLRMLAANIGAVVMPWMLYFQQSAVVARKLSSAKDVAQERVQSLVGSCLAQMIMVATMMVLAASPREAKNLDGIREIQMCLSPFFGLLASKIMISMAFMGGSVCAIFVASLAAAWAVCDSLVDDAGDDYFSLDKKVWEAPRFYSAFACIVIFGALVLLVGPNLVKLNVYIEVLNAIVIPMALFCLYMVVTGPRMPEKLKVVGLHKYVICSLFTLTSVVAVISTLASFLPDPTPDDIPMP